jgi:hypothetical protein
MLLKAGDFVHDYRGLTICVWDPDRVGAVVFYKATSRRDFP